MRSDALFRLDNTFDVYGGVYTQDPISGELIGSYELTAVHQKGLVVPGAQGAVYLSTKTSYALRSAVRNVKDRNGTSIFYIDGDEYDMYIVDANPQYNAFGSIVGWKHTLMRTITKTMEERLKVIRADLVT